MAKPKLFIGSSGESVDVAYAIQVNLKDDADVEVWKQSAFQLSSFTLEDLINIVRAHDFGVFVFEPDDLVKIRDKQSFTTRDNVVFELGLFIGRLGRERCFIVTRGDAPDFHMLTDLKGITTAVYTPGGNLQASLGVASTQIRTAVRRLGRFNECERVIYDGRAGFEQEDIKERFNPLFDNVGKPTTEKAEGKVYVEGNGELQIVRENTEGRCEIFLQHNGPNKPAVAAGERYIQVRCEVKAESGEHTLRFVLKDETAQKMRGDKTLPFSKNVWEQVGLNFTVPPGVDLSFRIDEQVTPKSKGSVRIRKLFVTESFERPKRK